MGRGRGRRSAEDEYGRGRRGLLPHHQISGQDDFERSFGHTPGKMRTGGCGRRNSGRGNGKREENNYRNKYGMKLI